MKTWLPIILLASFISGCAGYFSETRTVYRIETTTGQRFYSEDKPEIEESTAQYEITDLDGNVYKLTKGSIVEIEKFTHKK